MILRKLNESNDTTLDRVIKEFDKYYTPPTYAEQVDDNLFSVIYTNKYLDGSNNEMHISLVCGVDTANNEYAKSISIYYNNELTFRVEGEYFPFKDYEFLVTHIARDMDDITKAQRVFKNTTHQHNIITYDLLNTKYRNKVVKAAEKFQRTLTDLVQ